jgi:hypothetical protein
MPWLVNEICNGALSNISIAILKQVFLRCFFFSHVYAPFGQPGSCHIAEANGRYLLLALSGWAALLSCGIYMAWQLRVSPLFFFWIGSS